jgi:transglycosylase-like protein with SLT domain
MGAAEGAFKGREVVSRGAGHQDMSVDASNTTLGVEPSRTKVAGAIKQAANATGASFEYLVATAKMESNLNPAATASTSSAKGLYQFIDQTWLGTVKEAGAQFGYGDYADAISKSASGSYSVSDPQTRAAVLKLRDDPVASAAMAGVLTQSNSFTLTGKIGRRPTDGELYMAHFMGVGGAAKLISNAEDNPNVSGAKLFPNAAAANRSIFYDRSGNARSVSEVYSVLTSRFASAANSPTARTAMAAAGVTPASTKLASAAPAAIDNAAYLSSFPDLRSVTPVTATSASGNAASPNTDPIFRSLFQGGDRSAPVSPAVQELWGRNGSSLTSTASASTQTPAVRAPQPLDLFSDRAGIFSS